MNVNQPDFIDRHLVGIQLFDNVWVDAVAGIPHRDAHPAAALRNANRHHAFAAARLDAMHNSVLHQRLNKQAGDAAVHFVVDIVNHGQLVAKARLLNRDVILNLVQLFFDINLLVVVQFDVVAQVAREIKNQLARGVRVQAYGR